MKTCPDFTFSGGDKLQCEFLSVEGGIVGTIADSEDFSVKLTGCTFENAETEIADRLPHDQLDR